MGLPETECIKAAKKVFASDPVLMREAIVVTHFENRSGNPKAIGYNKDPRRTLDLGCFQINKYWQRYRIAEFGDPFDPMVSARIAYDIAKDDGHWRAWYAVCTKGKERFPLDRCGR